MLYNVNVHRNPHLKRLEVESLNVVFVKTENFNYAIVVERTDHKNNAPGTRLKAILRNPKKPVLVRKIFKNC